MQDGNLGVVLATFLYLVHRTGGGVQDASVKAACEAIDGAGEGEADTLGQALAELLREKVGSSGFEAVREALVGILGEGAVKADVGRGAEDREARIASVRRALFGRSLPWIALMIDRFEDGTVGEHWVMVEAFTDQVQLMDPYPWDDKDESRTLPLVDFLVRWELAGFRSLWIQ